MESFLLVAVMDARAVMGPRMPPKKRARAFSSEVDTGSREENASKQEKESLRSDSIGTEKTLDSRPASSLRMEPA
jgi:hypothetical protein